MKITERKLRSVIRSVIRESQNASQRRESHKHLDQPYMYNDDFVHAKNAAATLFDYYNRLPSRSQTRGMDRIFLKNIIHRTKQISYVPGDDKVLQKQLVEMLNKLDKTVSYDRYIGNVVFWRKVHDRFSEIIEQEHAVRERWGSPSDLGDDKYMSIDGMEYDIE